MSSSHPNKSASPHLEARIAALATRQHGVVTCRQLATFGISRGSVAYRARTGRLHRIHHGVYSVGHPILGERGIWMAAALAGGPQADVGYRSAAALWGLRPDSRPCVDITVAGRGSRRRPGLVIHRCARRHPEDRTVIHGIPVTTVARTLIDLAEVVPENHLRRAIVRGEQLRILDISAIQVAADRSPGRRHGALLQAVISGLHPDAHLTRSDMEILMLEIVDAHGLPRPSVNTILLGEEVDFFWPDRLLVVETDGFATHRTRAAFTEDRARDRKLQAAGYSVMRFTDSDVTHHAARTATELRDALTKPATPWPRSPPAAGDR